MFWRKDNVIKPITSYVWQTGPLFICFTREQRLQGQSSTMTSWHGNITRHDMDPWHVMTWKHDTSWHGIASCISGPHNRSRVIPFTRGQRYETLMFPLFFVSINCWTTVMWRHVNALDRHSLTSDQHNRYRTNGGVLVKSQICLLPLPLPGFVQYRAISYRVITVPGCIG